MKKEITWADVSLFLTKEITDHEETISLNNSAKINYSAMRMPMWTVYTDKTSDYPGKYVARLFDLDHPTKYVIVRETVQDIRDQFPDWMACIGRGDEDDPVILEVSI